MKVSWGKLTVRQVRARRRWISANRCSARPGLTHKWERDAAFDPTSFGAVIEFWTCAKCKTNDGI